MEGNITGKNDRTVDLPVCGIIMPISDSDPYRPGHWREVQNIIEGALSQAGMKARLVSEDDAVTIIQKTIVNNVYFDEIAVCDVRGRNPNVMLELGMRIAFNKAVVVIKDELTEYPFDASALEYVRYTSDLRHQGVIDFQKKLSAKITATYRNVMDKTYKSFLDTFGNFDFVDLKKSEIPASDLILRELRTLSNRVAVRSNEMQPFANDILHTMMFPLPQITMQAKRRILEEARVFFDNEPIKIHLGAASEDGVQSLLFSGAISDRLQHEIQTFMAGAKARVSSQPKS